MGLLPSLLFLLLLVAGGAAVLTILTALSNREAKRGGRNPREVGPEPDSIDQPFAGLERLASVEGKITQLSRLIGFAEKDSAANADLLVKQRRLLDYLQTYRDRYAALVLRQRYCEELEWLLSLVDDETWIEKLDAFRGRLFHSHEELGAGPYFDAHPLLDLALKEILSDLESTTQSLLSLETGKMIGEESPLEEEAIARRCEELRNTSLESGLAELNRSFDRFMAELDLQ